MGNDFRIASSNYKHYLLSQNENTFCESAFCFTRLSTIVGASIFDKGLKARPIIPLINNNNGVLLIVFF